VIYARLSCECSLASRTFYFRTEQSHNFFQVKYLPHVEYALKNFAVCRIQEYHRFPVVENLFHRPGTSIDLGRAQIKMALAGRRGQTKALLGQIGCAKLENAKNLFGWQSLAV
jgi:hypothetical protein